MILRLVLLQTKSICFTQVRFLSIEISRCFCELTDSMVFSCIEAAMLLLAGHVLRACYKCVCFTMMNSHIVIGAPNIKVTCTYL